MASQVELTPCGAMFDIFKRAAHLSHIELCGLVLSSRPLADGRSPQSRAADRSWVSRFIVRAPVGTLQQRYFAEYGTSAARIMSQLALRQRNPMDSTAVINMVCGPAGEPMVRALAWHVDDRGRTRTRPGAPLGLAARAKQFCRERPALDSAE